jgi:hypothetical protein
LTSVPEAREYLRFLFFAIWHSSDVSHTSSSFMILLGRILCSALEKDLRFCRDNQSIVVAVGAG